MKWIVRYRGKSGATETRVYEAESRSALFPLLQSDGITPIKIEEGAVEGRGTKWPRVAVAVLLVAAVVGLLLLLIMHGVADAGDEAKVETSVKPSASNRVKSAHRTVQYQKPPKTGDRLADALAAVEAAENALTIQSAPKVKIPAGYTNRTFKTGVEQLMSWVFTTEVGDMPMPIPAIGDEERKQLSTILLSKNEVKDGDSERTIFAKETVDYAKEEMRKFIEQGGDPDEFLQYYYSQLRHAFEFRNEAQQQYYDLQEEDPKLAEEFAQEVNKSFDEKGIKHILTEKDEQEEEGYIQ